jgi:hypothetical protein
MIVPEMVHRFNKFPFCFRDEIDGILYHLGARVSREYSQHEEDSENRSG